jgi:light-dependent protochlorophyllide reductase
MSGRVVIVTGASSGLGYQVAKDLCDAGNDVIMACRNEEKTLAAIAKIKLINPDALATYIHLDLASLESVRKFVEEFHQLNKQLNVLVNNAGVSLNVKDKKIQWSEDNFEITMATNYLGHFLLTNLLLDDLKRSACQGDDTRVVVVTSAEHDPKSCKTVAGLQCLDLDNMFLQKANTYSALQAYKNSKTSAIMFTYELSRRLAEGKVKVNAVCPGFIPSTDLLRNATCGQRFVRRCILDGLLKFTRVTRTIRQGAATICSVATDDKFKESTGKYIKEGEEAVSSEESLNEDLQKKLWELSAGYVHLKGYEPIDAPVAQEEDQTVKKSKKEASFKQPRKLLALVRGSKKGETSGGEAADSEKKELLEGESEKLPMEAVPEVSVEAIDLSADIDEKGEKHGEEKKEDRKEMIETKVKEPIGVDSPSKKEEDKKSDENKLAVDDGQESGESLSKEFITTSLPQTEYTAELPSQPADPLLGVEEFKQSSKNNEESLVSTNESTDIVEKQLETDEKESSGNIHAEGTVPHQEDKVTVK